MALVRWKRLSTEVLHENPFWRYRRDVFEREGGTTGQYFYVSTHGSVMIVPVLDDGRFVLVEQYRYLSDRFSLEFPAGGMHADEKPAVAAVRELAEETGYEGSLELLGSHNPCNGLVYEICHVFRATGLVAMPEPPKGDDTESFTIHRLTADEVKRKIRDGTIWDGMTLAAWALVGEK